MTQLAKLGIINKPLAVQMYVGLSPGVFEEERVRELLSVSESINIIVKKHSFSNEVVHKPGEEAKEHTERGCTNNYSLYIDGLYTLKVFANGSNSKSEGYVSVTFCMFDILFFEGTCFISVIDASGDQRFLQSFELHSATMNPFSETTDSEQMVVIEKYISRETLFASPSDLLPNDTLTLQIDIYLVAHPENIYVHQRRVLSLVHKSFETNEGNDGKSYTLLLDSPLLKHLSKESNYFQRMLCTSMIETERNCMNVPEEEYLIFEKIAYILLDLNSIAFNALSEIFDTYIVADKYDIPIITETCLCFLKLYLSVHNVDEVLELAGDYKHWNLKAIIESLVEEIRTKNWNKSEAELKPKYKVRDCQWTYKHYNTNPEWSTIGPQLVFYNQNEPTVLEEESPFDFYK